MTWTVQRMARKNRDTGTDGFYYSALLKSPKRSVTIGFLDEAPPPASLTSRLRAHPDSAKLTDDQVKAICKAATDEEAADLMREAIKLPAAHLRVATPGPAFPITPGKPSPAPAGVSPAPAPVYRGTPKNPFGALTLREFHDSIWWPVRSAEVAKSSVQREGRLWPVILDQLGDRRVCDLNAVEWRKFLDGQTRWGQTMRRLAQNAYRCALAYAVEIDAIEGVHGFRAVKAVKGAGKAREGRALKDEEIAVFLDAAATPAHRAMYGVLIGQGLRPGEAVLTWEQFDFERGVLHVHGTKNKGADAPVPLTEITLREVKPYWISLGRPTSGACFLWRSKPITKIERGVTLASKRAGIGHVCPYDFRHTFASWMARNGWPLTLARKMMRHDSESSILLRYYTHLDVDDLVSMVGKLSASAA